jgi:hypothetical protein
MVLIVLVYIYIYNNLHNQTHTLRQSLRQFLTQEYIAVVKRVPYADVLCGVSVIERHDWSVCYYVICYPPHETISP